MAREIYRKIIELVLRAAELARSIGINNLLQPGLVKEMIIADILGHHQTKCKVIYEIAPESVVAETERQLDRSRNAISHVGFSEDWARRNGKLVYEDK
jgi:hypothetical protein